LSRLNGAGARIQTLVLLLVEKRAMDDGCMNGRRFNVVSLEKAIAMSLCRNFRVEIEGHTIAI
jgi:hypothetical protein